MNANDILQKQKIKNFDAGIVFSGKKSGTAVMGYEKPCQFTPQINPDYIFHETSRDVIVWLIAPPSPLYVCGPSGGGKSSLINQLAARLNYPVFEVTGHNRLEFQDLAGHHVIQNGNMRFEYQGGHSPEELAVLMELFAEAMPNENPQSIRRAFAMHRKLSTRFPTPAHIIALLPDCRVMPDRCAIPEKTSVPATDGPWPGGAVRFARRNQGILARGRQGKNQVRFRNISNLHLHGCAVEKGGLGI